MFRLNQWFQPIITIIMMTPVVKQPIPNIAILNIVNKAGSLSSSFMVYLTPSFHIFGSNIFNHVYKFFSMWKVTISTIPNFVPTCYWYPSSQSMYSTRIKGANAIKTAIYTILVTGIIWTLLSFFIRD